MGNACRSCQYTIDEGAKAFSIAELFLSIFNLLVAVYIYIEVVSIIAQYKVISISQRIVFISAAIFTGTLILQSVFGFMIYILGWKRRNITICILWIISAIPNILLPWLILIFGSCEIFFRSISTFLTGESDSNSPPTPDSNEIMPTTEPCSSSSSSSDSLGLADVGDDDDYIAGLLVESTSAPEIEAVLPGSGSSHLHCGYWNPLLLYLIYPIFGIWIMISFIRWARKNGIARTLSISMNNNNAVSPALDSTTQTEDVPKEESKNPLFPHLNAFLELEMVLPEMNANSDADVTEVVSRVVSKHSSSEFQGLCRIPRKNL